MSAATDAFEVLQRNHWFRSTSVPKPTTITVHLYTAAPGEAGGGTEVTGGSYTPVNVNPSDANWSALSATDGLTDNVSAITFPAPTANWGLIPALGIKFDTVLVLYGTLDASKTVNNGDPAPSFAAGALNVVFG